MALHEFDYENEPTVAIVKKILSDSVKMKATDIHFDSREDHLSIKFRINGDLQEYTTAPENVKVNIITRIKILAGMNITESTTPQVGSIHFEAENISQNMRVSTLPIIEGEKVVVHLSNYAMNIKNIDKLGIKRENLKKLKDLLKEHSGILLITGTTGSGKSTTLYSILKELNNKSSNIISIEEPIKMKLDGINQVELNPDKGVTLKNVLHNILLQDPNIISISELYDDETARSAIRTALTGRLVISTMQTKSAFQTIDTLLNMDIENYLLGSYLNGIISQRIVKKLCPSCRDKRPATKYEKAVIKKILHKDIDEVYYADGCEDCRNGYIRQIPISEVVVIDDELRSAISNNKDHSEIRKMIYEKNDSILKDGLEKVISGETSFEEIMRVLDIKIDLTEEDQELKEIILGNTNDSILDNVIEGKDEPKKEKLSDMIKEVKEEVKPEEKEEPPKEEEKKEEPKEEEKKEEPPKDKTTSIFESIRQRQEGKKEEPKEEEKKEEPPKEEEKKEEDLPIKIELNTISDDDNANEEKEDEEKQEETKDEEKQEEPKVNLDNSDDNKEESSEEAPEDKEETSDETKSEDKEEKEEPLDEPKVETNEEKDEETESEDDDEDEDDDDFNYGDSYKLKI